MNREIKYIVTKLNWSSRLKINTHLIFASENLNLFYLWLVLIFVTLTSVFHESSEFINHIYKLLKKDHVPWTYIRIVIAHLA
jgi:hypothetical protein